MNKTEQNAEHRSKEAILFMIGAGFLIAATSILAKALGADTGRGGQAGLNPLQVSAGRFCFAFICLSIFVVARGCAAPLLANANWNLQISRSLCGWLGVSAMFAAIAKMPVAEAVAISFLSPVVTMGLAVLLLGEYLGFTKLVSSCSALLGAVLILKPGTEAFQVTGFWALAAASLMGLESIFIKKLSDTEPAIRVLFLNNGIGAILSLAAVSLVWVWPSKTQWILLATLGAVMICAQSMFIQSMKRSDASLVVPAFYSVLVFAALFDLLLYDIVPDRLAICGMLLIVLGAVLLTKKGPH